MTEEEPGSLWWLLCRVPTLCGWVGPFPPFLRTVRPSRQLWFSVLSIHTPGFGNKHPNFHLGSHTSPTLHPYSCVGL